MNFGFSARRSYLKLNSAISERVKCDENESIMGFLGVGHGLSELCISLANMFEHKRAVAVVTGVSPFFDDIAIYFSRQGYKVQKFEYFSDDSSRESYEEWIEGLDRGTLFLLNSADHPISGEVFHDFALFEKIDQKKIYQIQCSYNYHSFYPEKMSAHQHGIRLISVSPNRAYARLGSRLKLKPVVAAGIDWSEFSLQSFLPEQDSALEQKDLVLDFENKQSFGASPFFSSDANRIYDRAVLYWNDLDSSAIRSLLKEKGIIKGDIAGYEREVESFSFCRWQEIESFSFCLRKKDQSIDRGLLVINQSLLDDGLKKTVKEVVEEIRQLQGKKRID